MSSAGLPRPFVVAAFFYDAQSGQAYHHIQALETVSSDDAAAKAVSYYYTHCGGKLPLASSVTLTVPPETCAKGVLLFEAIEKADKTEEAKVVNLVPAAPPNEPPVPAPTPSDEPPAA